MLYSYPPEADKTTLRFTRKRGWSMKPFGIALGVLAAVLIVSCSPSGEPPKPTPSAPSQADTAAVNKLRDDFTAAFNAGDAARAADLYAPDAVLMPQNQPAVTGREGIRSYMQGTFDKFTVNISIASDEMKFAGDWAFDRGTYKIKLTPKPGGDAIEENNKYLVILQRQADGSWKVARDIDNSSKSH